MIATPGPNFARVLRLIVAGFGGYAFAAGVVAVISAGLPNLGMAPTESATLGGLLGILVYLVIILWAASSPRPVRMAVVVATLSSIMLLSAPMMVAG